MREAITGQVTINKRNKFRLIDFLRSILRRGGVRRSASNKGGGGRKPFRRHDRVSKIKIKVPGT